MLDVVSLSGQIENLLREQILGGELIQGQKISIDEISARLGVSSTPVRDAIRRLEKVGFLKVSPRRGVYVAEFDQKDFKNIFDLRIALECLAIESAAECIPTAELDLSTKAYQDAYALFAATGDRSLLVQHDPLIHDVIVTYCDNNRLKDLVRDLHSLLDWARRNVSLRRPETYEMAYPEHIQILEALQERNADKAQLALRTHLKNSFKRAISDSV
jgi:DNA-binding GntR family transcriptional regulator